MKKKLLFSVIVLLFLSAKSQVGINTETPDPSSVLDIHSDSKGVLLPRVTLASRTQALSDDNANAVGLLVYHVGSSSIPQGFYSWNGTSWVQFVDDAALANVSYWSAQGAGTAGGKTGKDDKEGASDKVVAVKRDIFQEGKVGVGYYSEVDPAFDFDVNKSIKQLEVGGDFRTTKFVENAATPGKGTYYGFETNSVALPSSMAIRGNVMYSGKEKSLNTYSLFDTVYDGSIMIQSNDKIYFLSRIGKLSDTNGTTSLEVQNSANGQVIFSSNSNKGSRLSQFTPDGQFVMNFGDHDVQYGLDFELGKFYIGNSFSGDSYYTFPTVQGTVGQILKLDSSNTLEWSDDVSAGTIPAAQKFFYMPSIVIDTKTVAAGKKRNLYKEYVAQFTNKEFIVDDVTGGDIGTSSRSTFVKSPDAPAAIATVAATGLHYYVTDYDKTALANLSIDNNGILTYDVIAGGTDYSFLNIVFVVK